MRRTSMWVTAIALAMALVMVLAGCTPAAPAAPAAQPTQAPSGQPATAKSVDMGFVVWSYGIETIQDNIKKFQAKYPNITINLQDFSWLDYHDTIVSRATANTPTDLLYGSDHWLQEWAKAGWIVPLDTYFPQVKDYVKEMAPYAVQGMTYNGQVYGLPYYADTLIFVYNEEQLKQAGFDKPPATWEELAQQAKTIKEKGICEYPMILAFSQKEGASIEAFYAMVYSRAAEAGSMFDANNNPTFNKPGGPAQQTVEWLAAAMKDGILDPASLQTAEIDQVKSMQAGAHTFTIFPSYNLAELNKPASSNLAGKFKMALMPGSSHATNGYVRFYAMSGQVPKRGQEALDAAWKFLEYFAGKTDGQYVVVKRWAVENGLGFAQLPLFNDPDVQKAFGAWGDVNLLQEQAKLARVKEGLTPFFGAWDVFARAELHKAYLGQESATQALDAMAAKWAELSK